MAFVAPRVMVLVSSASCHDGPSSDITKQVEADAQAFTNVFPHAQRIDSSTLWGEPASLGAAGGRPVLFFYSGHGISLPTADGGKESHLCLPEGELAFSRLARWVEAQGGRQSTIILNSCESADVDPSADGLGEMSVMSAAIDTTMAISPVAPEGTPVARGLMHVFNVAALAMADRNCDLVVTDQELFDALDDALRTEAWQNLAANPGSALAVPVPKLRRNADLPLPLFQLAQRSPRCAALLANFERLSPPLHDLAGYLADGHAAPSKGRRRATFTDYFVVADPRGRVAAAENCADFAENGRVVCRQLEVGLRLLPLSQSVELGELSVVAQLATTGEVYAARLDSPWVELLRVRDGMTTAVATRETVAEVAPARAQTVQHSIDGRVLRHYYGKVCPRRWPALEARATPCTTSTGQCFWLKREPRAEEELCQ